MFHVDRAEDRRWPRGSNDRQDMVLPLLVRDTDKGCHVSSEIKTPIDHRQSTVTQKADILNDVRRINCTAPPSFPGGMNNTYMSGIDVYLQSVSEVVERCFHVSSNILSDTGQWQRCHFWKSNNGRHRTACTEKRTSSLGQARRFPLGSLSSQIRSLQDSRSLWRVTGDRTKRR